MKKILLIIGFVCLQSLSAQNIMDFDLKNVELQGMQPVKINREMKSAGITGMPFVTDSPDVISKIADAGIASKIAKIYGFIYNNPKDDLHDGGVYIYQFKTKKDLNNYLAKNFEQPNYRVLVKDLFYIRIWSDYSYQIKGRETSDDHLNKLEKYYTGLGAEKILLKPDKSIISVVQ